MTMGFQQLVNWSKGIVILIVFVLPVAIFVGSGSVALAIGTAIGLGSCALMLLTVHGYISPQLTVTVFRDPNGYIRRVVPEGLHVIYSVLREHPAEVISTGFLSTEDRYSGFRTRDNVPVDLYVKIFAQRDPTRIPLSELPKYVALNDEAWKSLIRTVVRGTVMQFVGSCQYKHIAAPLYRDALCAALSREAARALAGMGIIIPPTFGVSVQDIQPTNAILEAVIDRHTAPLKGQAAVEALEPITEQFGPENALEAAIAATIITAGTVPSVLQQEVEPSPIPAARPRKSVA